MLFGVSFKGTNPTAKLHLMTSPPPTAPPAYTVTLGAWFQHGNRGGGTFKSVTSAKSVYNQHKKKNHLVFQSFWILEL